MDPQYNNDDKLQLHLFKCAYIHHIQAKNSILYTESSNMPLNNYSHRHIKGNNPTGEGQHEEYK